jgi:hypothetical protein
VDIMVTLTGAEQDLLLVNEHNDGPDTQPDAWSTIARKVRAAQSIEPGTYCTCCLDNECECSGTAISGSAALFEPLHSHLVTICPEDDSSGWRVDCTCGWESEVAVNYETAITLRDDHLDEKTRKAG